MGTQSNKKNSKTIAQRGTGATSKNVEFEVDVLFQRIYNKWYAFSVVEDDCLVTQVPEKEVHKRWNSKKALKNAA